MTFPPRTLAWFLLLFAVSETGLRGATLAELSRGFASPPAAAKPHAYWLWLNGNLEATQAEHELRAMQQAGLGGVLIFDMGARGPDAPPAGPAFLSDAWLGQLKHTLTLTKTLGLQVDLSAISSWDLGGPWVEPRHASMGLYPVELGIDGGTPVDVTLPFPVIPGGAPLGADGRPAFWTDIAVLAVKEPERADAHEIIWRVDPDRIHDLASVTLEVGSLGAEEMQRSRLTPVKRFRLAVATTGAGSADFTEVLRGELTGQPGPQSFPLPAGTKARYVRLQLVDGQDAARDRLVLGEIAVLNAAGGVNVIASRYANPTRSGALIVRGAVPLGYDAAWNLSNLHDGETAGPGGVFATAGLPPLRLAKGQAVIDVTSFVDRDGRLRWLAPAGRWTLLRYVCMNTGQKLKVASPASNGLTTDHLSAEATRVTIEHVLGRLRDAVGDLKDSGLTNLYLASFEVTGPIWSPTFAGEFERRRGYPLIPFLPAVFGAEIENEDVTERFLFDFRKTLGEVVIDAYYREATKVANRQGLRVKSEAGGPGPPMHNPPVDALLANGAVDEVQGEFWPFWPDNEALWVVKETASAAHIYGKSVVHMESFTSFEHWGEGPRDLKSSADRMFAEGGNHVVWHTWAHQFDPAGIPGPAYSAGTHLNRKVTWWPQAPAFLSYLARCSYLLQSGTFVADALIYYGDGGYNFVGPKTPALVGAPGYDYDVINAEVLLSRLTVKDGRVCLPGGPSYAVLVLPDRKDIALPVLETIARLVAQGARVVGPRPSRTGGLADAPALDRRIQQLTATLWENQSGAKPAIADITPVAALQALGIGPDFSASAALDYLHRHTSEAELYFVRNRTDQPVNETAVFRVHGRDPELWDAVTGNKALPAHHESTAAGTAVSLHLPPNGSVFVVFPIQPSPDVTAALAEQPGAITLAAPWTVRFPDTTLGEIHFAQLSSWSERSEELIRYFSGTAHYQTTIKVGAEWLREAGRVCLDLGDLATVADVRVNGRDVGAVWTYPFRADVTAAIRAGDNLIEVDVTNTWNNRLVGEANSTAPTLRTNITEPGRRPWSARPLKPSGLFGPVQLVRFTVPAATPR